MAERTVSYYDFEDVCCDSRSGAIPDDFVLSCAQIEDENDLDASLDVRQAASSVGNANPAF